MPKIFLIKDRLHQQQLRLQESQHLIQAKNSDQLSIEDTNDQSCKRDRVVDVVETQEPLSLVSKKRNKDEQQQQPDFSNKKETDSGKFVEFICTQFFDTV